MQFKVCNLRNNYISVIIGSIALLSLIVYFYYLKTSAENNLVSSVCTSAWKYCVLIFLITVCIISSVKNRMLIIVYVSVLFLFFTWLSFSDQLYSPIDEIMNYENINFIIRNKRLPTIYDSIDAVFLNSANSGLNDIGDVLNYEAVQAPLFYIIFAAIGCFFRNACYRFHFLRLVSLYSVLLILYSINKAKQYLNSKNYNIDEESFRLVLLIIVLNPAYLYRASRLNNEILVCVLCALLIYFAAKCIVEGFQLKHYWIMSILCGALFLTKNTAVYAYTVILVIALLQKRLSKAIIPVLVSFIPFVPWFLFNLRTYGALTGIKEHLRFVLIFANPSYSFPNLFDAFSDVLPNTFFSAEEVSFTTGDLLWSNICYLSFIAIICISISEIIHVIKNNSLPEEIDTKTKLNIVYVSLVICCLLCLTTGTVVTRIISIRGRYLYGPGISVILLLIINNESIPKKTKRVVSVFLIIAIGVLTTRVMITFTDRVYSYEHLYGKNIHTLELFDLTDEYWTHGYSNKDNVLLLESEHVSDYSSLVGRSVSNGTDHAVITGISEHQSVDANNYVWLYTSQKMDSNNKNSNTINIGSYCPTVRYNMGKPVSILDNIEEASVSQSMIIKEKSIIYGFSLNLITYYAKDYSAQVFYSITDSSATVIQEGIILLSDIQDNSYSTFYLEEPICVENNESIAIMLKYDNPDDLPLTMRVSDNDSYPDGSLYVDGKEQTGQDLLFRLIAQRSDY